VLHQECAGLLHFDQEQRLVVLLGRDSDRQHYFTRVALDGIAGGGQVQVDLRLPVAFGARTQRRLVRAVPPVPALQREVGLLGLRVGAIGGSGGLFVGHLLILCVVRNQRQCPAADSASKRSSSPLRSRALVSS